MTKEQEKETIKYLEFLQKEYLEDAKRKKENGEITGYGTMEDIDKLRALYIGFALDMLKEKDEEIEKLKVDNENVWKLNANMSQRHLSDIFRIKKKDKQIDLMAEFIFQNIDVEEEICNSAYIECKQETAQDITCINCIKQYFERKSEEC